MAEILRLTEEFALEADLTEAEKSVAVKVANGLTIRQVTGELGVATFAAERFRLSVCEKLGFPASGKSGRPPAARWVLAEVMDRGCIMSVSQQEINLANNLNARRKEILRLAAWGYAPAEIAAELNATKGAVDVETNRAKRSLNAPNPHIAMQIMRAADTIYRSPDRAASADKASNVYVVRLGDLDLSGI